MKKILLSLFAGLTMGSAIAIPAEDVCNPYDEMQDQALNDLAALRSAHNPKDLSHEDFIQYYRKVIAYGLRVHSLRITPAGCAHNNERYVEFASSYLAQIEVLDVSKSIMTDLDKREKYAHVLEMVVYFLTNQYPFVSEVQNQKKVKEFEVQLAVVLKEYFGQTVSVDHDAQQIATILDSLTVDYYQTILFPEQQELLKVVDKVEDEQLREMKPTALLKMIRRYDREAQESQ